jgi:16S rRNA (cytosine1402-N4)-methyltransferase
LEHLGEDGRVLALDRDPEAVATGKQLAQKDARLTMLHSSFSALSEVAKRFGLSGQVDGIIFDLGVSSPQLDQPARGFSFQDDGPLDMRMDPTTGPSAAEWINAADEREIANVLRNLGEERFARRVAHAVVEARRVEPLQTTRALADVVSRAVPVHERAKHPATRSFQAIRVHINQELEQLRAALEQVIPTLKIGGRLVVISFHSLEDRIVKRFIRDHERGPSVKREQAVLRPAFKPDLRRIGSAQRASPREVAANPRSRSAVLRAAERCA